MWGCISTDNLLITNFSVGYTSMKSDVIVHLAQWQYWWWFWFSFLWGFYYLTVTRVVRARFLKFRPKIYTSFRSHGKWGDFLACIIPTIWCLNILTNSSFILRLMEWQNESSLFTVRIRGRQWYWIYKFELRSVVDIVTVPKNIGSSRWVTTFGGAHEVTDNYFHSLKLRNQNAYFKRYWNEYMRTITRNADSLNSSFSVEELFACREDYQPSKEPNKPLARGEIYLCSRDGTTPPKKVSFRVANANSLNTVFAGEGIKIPFNNFVEYMSSIFQRPFIAKLISYYTSSNSKPITLEPSRFTKKNVSEAQPILITKNIITKRLMPNSGEVGSKFVPLNFFFNADKTVKKKLYNDQLFYTIKQKRYKLKKFIPLRAKYKNTNNINTGGTVRFSDRPFLTKHSFITNLDFDASKLYQMIKKNKVRSEVFSVQLSKRLLRTRKTLVLPAHVNLTVITNSYDVIHSWFVPGLGIKLDCVPGRSTHHTFYADSVGFFYGQCAEICGRYHHHMPIRVCMLPYEHFFVWWQHFGLPKVLNTVSKKRYEFDYSFKRFNW